MLCSSFASMSVPICDTSSHMNTQQMASNQEPAQVLSRLQVNLNGEEVAGIGRQPDKQYQHNILIIMKRDNESFLFYLGNYLRIP
jgi:hypothetical protein